jgi:hypothetical protein
LMLNSDRHKRGGILRPTGFEAVAVLRLSDCTFDRFQTLTS